MGFMTRGFLLTKKMVAVMVGLKSSGRSGGLGGGDADSPNE